MKLYCSVSLLASVNVVPLNASLNKAGDPIMLMLSPAARVGNEDPVNVMFFNVKLLTPPLEVPHASDTVQFLFRSLSTVLPFVRVSSCDRTLISAHLAAVKPGAVL